MLKQINNIGTEKTISDSSDLIPIQQADGTTRRITKANLLAGAVILPATTNIVADNADYALMIDHNSGSAYKISKSNLLSGVSSTIDYFDQIIFLAHFNGANNSTVITDIKGSTITRYGNSKISTAQSRFGDGSLLLDGVGDYLSIPYSSVIDICGGDDFKLECWYYPLAITGNRPIFCQWKQVTNNGGFILGSAGSSIIFGFGAYSESVNLLTGGTLILNTWHHIAVTRIGNNFSLWLNGTKVASNFANVARSLTTVNYSIGSYYNSSNVLGAVNNIDCNAYINELRITKPKSYIVSLPSQPFSDT